MGRTPTEPLLPRAVVTSALAGLSIGVFLVHDDDVGLALGAAAAATAWVVHRRPRWKRWLLVLAGVSAAGAGWFLTGNVRLFPPPSPAYECGSVVSNPGEATWKAEIAGRLEGSGAAELGERIAESCSNQISRNQTSALVLGAASGALTTLSFVLRDRRSVLVLSPFEDDWEVLPPEHPEIAVPAERIRDDGAKPRRHSGILELGRRLLVFEHPDRDARERRVARKFPWEAVRGYSIARDGDGVPEHFVLVATVDTWWDANVEPDTLRVDFSARRGARDGSAGTRAVNESACDWRGALVLDALDFEGVLTGHRVPEMDPMRDEDTPKRHADDADDGDDGDDADDADAGHDDRGDEP